MATYATRTDLEGWLARNRRAIVPADEAEAELLLQQAERDVDRVLGRYPEAAPGALKLVPADLSDEQRAALRRACCAAVEWRLSVSTSAQVGDEDFLPAGLTSLRRAAPVSPRMLEELSGAGLSRRSGCAAPSPALPLEEYAPAQLSAVELAGA